VTERQRTVLLEAVSVRTAARERVEHLADRRSIVRLATTAQDPGDATHMD